MEQIKVNRKYFPLGSQCFTWDGLHNLNKHGLLSSERIYYYSPFNGTRVLNSYESTSPQLMFLTAPDMFISLFSDLRNWIPVSDDKDKEYINIRLNLRRCHVNDGIKNVIENVLNSYKEYKKFKYKYILDIRRDFHSTNMNQFFHTLQIHGYDVLEDFIVIYDNSTKYLLNAVDIQLNSHNISNVLYTKDYGEQMENLYHNALDELMSQKDNC